MADTTLPQPPDSPCVQRRVTARLWSIKRRRTTVAVALLLVALAGGGGYYRAEHSSNGQPASTGGGGRDRANPIVVEAAATQDFPVRLAAIGTVVPRTTVTVRSRVDGTLDRILFQEGQTVQAGELLAEIDPRPFEVALTQAQGQMARDQALLANARADQARYEELAKLDAIPSQQLDTQRALVRQYAATVKMDQGQVDNANLQLDYTHITASSAGRVGLRQVDPGNIVRSSDANGIVLLTQIQPVTVIFPIPEAELGKVLARLGLQTPKDTQDRLGLGRPDGSWQGRREARSNEAGSQGSEEKPREARRAGRDPAAASDRRSERVGLAATGGKGTKDGKMPGRGLAVQAWDHEGKVLLATGELLTVDNQIDISTGTVKVKALFPNKDGALFPNQFVNVRLVVSELKDATVIPSAAVQRGARGSFVWRLNEGNTVSMRQIDVGSADGDRIPVLNGLQAGEQVAVDGFDRLREGAKVEVVSRESRAVKTGPGKRGPRSGEPGKPKDTAAPPGAAQAPSALAPQPAPASPPTAAEPVGTVPATRP